MTCPGFVDTNQSATMREEASMVKRKPDETDPLDSRYGLT